MRPILERQPVFNGEGWFKEMMSGTVEQDNSVAQKTDSALVEAAATGDADSFTELCRRYYPSMVAIAHSILGDRHLAEDAAQQTFAKAAVNLPGLRRNSRFAAWLAAICRNAARDMARKVADVPDCEAFARLARPGGDDDSVEAVREAIGKLSASAREVIFLRFYDGMPYGQISNVLGISEQAINGRLRRAKKQIGAYLQRKGFREALL